MLLIRLFTRPNALVTRSLPNLVLRLQWREKGAQSPGRARVSTCSLMQLAGRNRECWKKREKRDAENPQKPRSLYQAKQAFWPEAENTGLSLIPRHCLPGFQDGKVNLDVLSDGTSHLFITSGFPEPSQINGRNRRRQRRPLSHCRCLNTPVGAKVQGSEREGLAS